MSVKIANTLFFMYMYMKAINRRYCLLHCLLKELNETPTERQHEHLEVNAELMDKEDWTTSKYLPYRKYNTRLKSFDSSADYIKIKASDLAILGFFYKGKSTYLTSLLSFAFSL